MYQINCICSYYHTAKNKNTSLNKSFQCGNARFVDNITHTVSVCKYTDKFGLCVVFDLGFHASAVTIVSIAAGHVDDNRHSYD